MEDISKNIKYYRKNLGLTRKELAEGVCDESTLFRIEKGNQLPRVDVLINLCKKLNLPIEYIVNGINSDEVKMLKDIKRLCRGYVYDMNYVGLRYIIDEFHKLKDRHTLGLNLDILDRFIKWHEAILVHEDEKDNITAEKLLLAINNSKLTTEIDIGIANSLGLVWLSLNKTDDAFCIFKDAFTSLSRLPIKMDLTIYPRVGYNLAFCYYNQKEYEEAIGIAYSLLSYLESNQLSFILGKTHHMIGILNKKNGYFQCAEEHLKKAQYLFYIEDKKEYYEKVVEDIQKLNNKII
ncbi:helix-turn-helix domain-containing protein [Bacillus sp. DJP31]|uniref:helix-turn-helix domain-containing protein n=1 Tax=Bacillus sp. DJP31 TaxID=3409789 RepID=UPI003BB53BC6